MTSKCKFTPSEQPAIASGVESLKLEDLGRSGGGVIGDRDDREGKTLLIPDLRDQLRQGMQECRQLTLDLFEGVDYSTFTSQGHPDFSPIGWHLGHIAYTESLWLLEHSAKQPCLFPQYRRLFAADGLPKSERGKLPTLPEIQDYLAVIREKVFEYLEIAPIQEQERLWRFLLQHESQHCETIAIVLELLRNQVSDGGCRVSGVGDSLGRASGESDDSGMVCVPAGHFICGSDSIDALDNERSTHQVFLETYWIDRYPVTNAHYRLFIEASGYQDSRWWSAAGWEWLQTAQVIQPLYWKDGAAWDDHPVWGVSWYEADAYARFVGKRLPTEFEWEKAARWNPETQQSQTYPWGEAEPTGDRCNHSHLVGHTTPVDRYPEGVSPVGCYDMMGSVWEWTNSWFESYSGFEPYPYKGYSQVYFDGKHRVLRGSSWATRRWAMRSAFRNWYHPHVREVFAGFRCVRMAVL